MTQWNAQINIVAKDLASPQIQRVTGSMNRMTAAAKKSAFSIRGAFSRMGAGFARLEIGRQVGQMGDSIAGMGMRFADEAGDFEQGLASIQAITRSGVDEMGQLRNASLDAAMTMPFKPSETISALQDMATKGLNAKASMAALIPTLDLAGGSMGQLGLAGAGDAVVGTMNALGWETDSLTKITDKLLRSTQLTNFQTRDFELGLSRSVASANQYGQSLDDTLVLLGLLRNNNIEASVASTAVRESWRKLASDQKKQQMVQKLGIELFDKQTGAVRPFIDVMSEASDALQDVGEKERLRFGSVVFGARGLAAFNAVSQAQARITVNGTQRILKGKDALNALRLQLLHTDDAQRDVAASALEASIGIEGLADQLKDATGTALGFRKAVLNTYKGQQQLVASVEETVRILAGEGLAFMLKPLLSAFVDFWTGMAKAINSLPNETRGLIMAIVTGFGMLLKITGGIAVLTGLMYAFGFGIKALAVGIGQFLLTLLPATILLTGFGLAFYSLFQSVQSSGDGMQTSLSDLWRQAKLSLQGIGELIHGESISGALSEELDKSNNTIAKKVVTWFTGFKKRWGSFWIGLKEGFAIGLKALGPQIDGLIERFKGLVDLFGGDSNKGLNTFKQDGIEAGMSLAKFGGAAIEVLTALVDAIKSVGEAMSDVSSKDIKSFIEGSRTAFTFVSDFVSAIRLSFHTIIDIIKIVAGTVVNATAIALQPFHWMYKRALVLWNLLSYFSGPRTEETNKATIASIEEIGARENPLLETGRMVDTGWGRLSGNVGGQIEKTKVRQMTNYSTNLRNSTQRMADGLQSRMVGGGTEDQKADLNLLNKRLKELDLVLSNLAKNGVKSVVEFGELAKGVQTAGQNDSDRSYGPSNVGFGV